MCVPGGRWGSGLVGGRSLRWFGDAHQRSDEQAGRSGQGDAAPVGVAVGFGSVWAADLGAKPIVRVNPSTERIVGRLRLRGTPVRLAVGFGSLWVRDDSGRVLRIKPATVT